MLRFDIERRGSAVCSGAPEGPQMCFGAPGGWRHEVFRRLEVHGVVVFSWVWITGIMIPARSVGFHVPIIRGKLVCSLAFTSLSGLTVLRSGLTHTHTHTALPCVSVAKGVGELAALFLFSFDG